ncbi:uncharacterized protein PFL1_01594 [Pseudozyma flocculosa PF-1]|uniref:Related to cytokinesis protein Don1 n=1 Tax=Pseudozyma flocculosa TaxID=84751 RepID=A0A5C3F116_9BASI|nr:uncharacterized protein PFL1_01594 [Pseudozyma flocculosa PF-1]EPQ30693.1 hypothetical protein PFL1_01594 [Pseudozyma flocculosa PF-1]SPO36971.1 related to cytokinesis protein Don1 [Pseudozyma flocculosa]
MSGVQSSMSFPTLPKSPELQQAESGPSTFSQAALRQEPPRSRPSAASPSASAVSLPARHSIDSNLTSDTRDPSQPSSTSASIGFPTAGVRPASRASAASSRPSSVASSSSTRASSHVPGQLAACPGILSPGLASALGLGSSLQAAPDGSPMVRRESTGSGQHRRVRAQSTQGPGSGIRRPSLPVVPSMHHRMSVASVSSFESLPEDEIVHGFALTSGSGSGPSSLAKARHSSYERSTPAGKHSVNLASPTSTSAAARAEARSPSPSSTAAFSSSIPSPSKLSQQLDAACSLHDREASTDSSTSASSMSSRPGILKRSATEPSQKFDLVQMLSRRKNAVMELLDSERSFMSSLELIDAEYYQPLKASLGGGGGGGGSSGNASPTLASSGAAPILERKALAEIFSNFSDILHLSKELLARLEARLGSAAGSGSRILARPSGSDASRTTAANNRPWDPALDTIGDILVPLAPFMKMYSLYVKNFSSALQRIEAERKANEAFASFLKETEQRRQAKEASSSAATGRKAFGFGLGFQAHLLTIVQRIPRYKLLVDDLIKSTPESHVDRPDLVKAGQTIEQVASYINENVRQHEMVLMMLSLQRSLQGLTEPLVVPGRSLVKRGTLMKTCRRNVQPREFFLFTDCIIYASPISGGIESASAAWLALAQKGGLYGAAANEPPAQALASPGDATAAIESIVPRARLRTISGPEPYTPLAGAIFSLAGHQLQFRDKFPLRDCTVVSVDDHSLHGLRYCFEIRTPGKSFAVYAETSASKEAWVAAIREAKADHMSARRTLRADEDSIEAKRDKRRSQHRIELQVTSSRRLSTQSLGQYIGLSAAPSSIPEAESESADVDVDVDGDALAVARTRTESAPNILRPPSFPTFPSNATGMSLATLLSPSAHATPTKPLRVLEDYNAPVWVPDNRAEKCACCSEAFGMWRRKHHCRLCGQVVCWNCSQRSFLIPAYQDDEDDKPARACDTCYDSVFPPDSPEQTAMALDVAEPAAAAAEPLPTSSTRQTVTGVNMAAAPSNDGSVSGRSGSSSGLFDSDTSPGSPATPAGDISPHFAQHPGRSPLGSPPSSATMRPELSFTDKAMVGRPKSLRFDNLPQPVFAPDARSYGGSPPKVPARSKSISGGAPRMPERSSAAEAQLFQAALHPQVQAATSGTGTFRLVTPRLTTPDSEVPPNEFGRRSSHPPSMMGGVSSYFGNAEGATGTEGTGTTSAASSAAAGSAPCLEDAANVGKGSEPFKPSMIHGPNGIPAHLRAQRKRPMSAADRLSTFYGANLALSSASEARKKSQ